MNFNEMKRQTKIVILLQRCHYCLNSHLLEKLKVIIINENLFTVAVFFRLFVCVVIPIPLPRLPYLEDLSVWKDIESIYSLLHCKHNNNMANKIPFKTQQAILMLENKNTTKSK